MYVWYATSLWLCVYLWERVLFAGTEVCWHCLLARVCGRGLWQGPCMEGVGESCSRVFSCSFSAQVPLCALRPTMGLCGGAGQRGADLCPPDTSAHYGHHLLRAGGHVRGKGARYSRCVRVPCLLMHQHAVMCALSCSPLPAPASFWACAICV
jgi:hypothetical protein